MNKHLLLSLAGMAFTTITWASGDHSHSHDDELAKSTRQTVQQENMSEGMMKHEHMTPGDMQQMHQHMTEHQHTMESLAGRPGKASDVMREIRIVADDNMRFMHEPLNIKDGETIRFMITNQGKLQHELSIGTREEHRDHSAMMAENPDMHHAPGGNTVTLAPGESRELIWTFENAWQIEAACNMPGHYQAGMHSPVTISE